jgi:hypothetical protein
VFYYGVDNIPSLALEGKELELRILKKIKVLTIIKNIHDIANPI